MKRKSPASVLIWFICSVLIAGCGNTADSTGNDIREEIQEKSEEAEGSSEDKEETPVQKSVETKQEERDKEPSGEDTSDDRKKVSYPWIIEPLIYTTILTCIMGWWSHWYPEMVFLSAAVFGLIIFSAMGEGRGSLIRRVTLKSKASAAKRQDGELVIDESKNILKNPYDNTPVFYEMDEKGQKVPVRIRFYTIGRWLSILFNGIITVTLPLIIAAFLRWASMEEGESFMEGFHPLYGAGWYTLTAFIVILYFVKGVRKDAYDHPIIYQVFPNGKTRLMGKRRDRKLSALAVR